MLRVRPDSTMNRHARLLQMRGRRRCRIGPDDATDHGAAKSPLFHFPADDGTEVALAVPSLKPLDVIRLYLRGAEIAFLFTHVEGGLQARDGALKGFVIAGVDRQWKPASARILDDRVIVSGPEVRKPVAVRYACVTPGIPIRSAISTMAPDFPRPRSAQATGACSPRQSRNRSDPICLFPGGIVGHEVPACTIGSSSGSRGRASGRRYARQTQHRSYLC